MYRLGEGSKKRLRGVHPKLQVVIETAIGNSPIDFAVTSGVRTVKEQKELWAQGRTKDGEIVTNADGITKRSNHQIGRDGYGWAVDFCPYIGGKLMWKDEIAFGIIADHIKKTAKSIGIKVEWGGDWKGGWDKPHIELK